MPKPINTGPQWVGPDLAIRPGMHPLVAKAILYRLGFERIGTGAVCVAFRLGQSDRVVKLVCDRAGHRGAVQLFQDYPEVEAFPTIFGYVELLNDCFIYETERLVDDGYGGSYCFDPSDCCEDTDTEIRVQIAEEFGWAVSDLVVDWATFGDFFLDLHSGNSMSREDGARVITDPFHRCRRKDAEGLLFVKTGQKSQRDRPTAPEHYWRNVSSTVPYRGATTTALVPLAQV